MPSRKTPDGEFKDIAHPINTETRESLQRAILSEYEKVLSEPVERPVEKPVEYLPMEVSPAFSDTTALDVPIPMVSLEEALQS